MTEVECNGHIFRLGDKVHLRSMASDEHYTDSVYTISYIGLRWVGTNKHGSSSHQKLLVTVSRPLDKNLTTAVVPERLVPVPVIEQLADLTDE